MKCVTLTQLLVVEGENEKVDQLNRIQGPGPVFEEDGGSGFIISDYQNYLESEWIKQLKEKYPVKVNRELLSRINPS